MREKLLFLLQLTTALTIQPAPRFSCCDLQGKGHKTVRKSQRHRWACFSSFASLKRKKAKSEVVHITTSSEELVKLCNSAKLSVLSEQHCHCD